MTGRWRLLRTGLAALLLAFAVPQGAPAQQTAPAEAEQPGVDYDRWEAIASKAEAVTAKRTSTDLELVRTRALIAEWRTTLLAAQSINVSRIATLRTQIEALGPVPAEGTAETEEIATRRQELNDQLARLQAPGIAAEEGYRRADGLIREVDRILRERQADELMRLWPAPINPANWPAALAALRDTGAGLIGETTRAWAKPAARAELRDNMPLILAYLLGSAALIFRGRPFMERLSLRLQNRASVRGRQILALLASMGQIVLPTAGVYALTSALTLTGMLGIVGGVVVEILPAIGFTIFTAHWLAGRIYPKGEGTYAPLQLSAERRAEGRLHVTIFGVLLGIDALRRTAMDPAATGEAATAVLDFPVLVVSGILLVRVGQLLRSHVQAATPGDEPASFRDRLINLVGRAAQVIGVLGPVLAAVGYVSAAAAIVYPAATSLGLLGLLFIVQKLVEDIYALVTGADADAETALVPVLLGFGLTLCTLPLFALIWGARWSDITELWTRFREGFALGDTRISPSDFTFFAIMFAIGYGVTRLLQGALKSTVLPKTSLDQGGQNAIVAGVGYVGIFLSGLIAINAAGINLAGLAIVAGALSVGIGFGLQNIVSNFVSGIILLIERPVSEGDWIEVGPVQGIVKNISVRSTRIQTFDRTDVIVPNTDLIAGRVTNWTRYNLSGRLIVPVAVPYTVDSRKVEAILREIAEAQPLALLNPPPLVVLMGFGSESMNFEVRVILRDVNFSLSVRSEMNHQIARRFAAAGIPLSSAHRDYLERTAAEAEALRLLAEEESQALDAIRTSFAELDAAAPAALPAPVHLPEPAP